LVAVCTGAAVGAVVALGTGVALGSAGAVVAVGAAVLSIVDAGMSVVGDAPDDADPPEQLIASAAKSAMKGAE